LTLTGRWSEAFGLLKQVPEERLAEQSVVFVLALPEALVAQGRVEEARHLVSLYAAIQSSGDFQSRTSYEAAAVVALRGEGNEHQALTAAEQVLEELIDADPTDQGVKVALPQALEAALALGERERAERLLTTIEALPPGRLAPSLRAHAARFRARLAAADGDHVRAEQWFASATSIFREYGMVFWLAMTLTEQAESLIAADRGSDAEPLLAEARATFEKLDAKPWLARVEIAHAGPRAEASV
jgi:hypothetical protein